MQLKSGGDGEEERIRIMWRIGDNRGHRFDRSYDFS